MPDRLSFHPIFQKNLWACHFGQGTGGPSPGNQKATFSKGLAMARAREIFFVTTLFLKAE